MNEFLTSVSVMYFTFWHAIGWVVVFVYVVLLSFLGNIVVPITKYSGRVVPFARKSY